MTAKIDKRFIELKNKFFINKLIAVITNVNNNNAFNTYKSICEIVVAPESTSYELLFQFKC